MLEPLQEKAPDNAETRRQQTIAALGAITGRAQSTGSVQETIVLEQTTYQQEMPLHKSTSVGLEDDASCAAERRLKVRRTIDRRRTLDRSQKDIWDKIQAIAPIISGVLIFLGGGIFTYTFNEQQLRLQEIQTIERFIPHLMGNERSKKAAVLAISSLTNTAMAGKIAAIFASAGTVSAMEKIATTGSAKDKETASRALAVALENLSEKGTNWTITESKYRHDIESSDLDNALPSDPDVAYKLSKLAQLYMAQDRFSLAEPLLKRALGLTENLYGPDHPQLLDTLKALAEVYQSMHRSADAEACLARARKIEASSLQQHSGAHRQNASADKEPAGEAMTEPPARATSLEKEAAGDRATINKASEPRSEKQADQQEMAQQSTE